ncbi:MAG: hypothetical protein J2P36_16825, partial [Ktedonobacteraceae bacterium]|nr:hypothetical protein [Ktedonobacteraceae bacterium]
MDTMPGGPLVECEYGWGQVIRLYQDHLELDGATYMLTDLLSVQLVYRHALGISSARLELHFKQKTLVVRGITELEEARALARHLRTQLACSNSEQFGVGPLRGTVEISTNEWFTAASVGAMGPELDYVGPIELPEPQSAPTTDPPPDFIEALSPTSVLSEVDASDDQTRRLHTE